MVVPAGPPTCHLMRAVPAGSQNARCRSALAAGVQVSVTAPLRGPGVAVRLAGVPSAPGDCDCAGAVPTPAAPMSAADNPHPASATAPTSSRAAAISNFLTAIRTVPLAIVIARPHWASHRCAIVAQVQASGLDTHAKMNPPYGVNGCPTSPQYGTTASSSMAITITVILMPNRKISGLAMLARWNTNTAEVPPAP